MSLLLTFSDSQNFCLVHLKYDWFLKFLFGDILGVLNSLNSLNISEKYVQKEVVSLK